MAQSTPWVLQPFVDYAPPVRTGRRGGGGARARALVCRLAALSLLLATGVGAFGVTHHYGTGWASLGLALLGLAALVVRRRRRLPLPAAVATVVRGLARLLRLASWLGVGLLLLIALRGFAEGRQGWNLALLLALLAPLPLALAALGGVLRWAVGAHDTRTLGWWAALRYGWRWGGDEPRSDPGSIDYWWKCWCRKRTSLAYAWWLGNIHYDSSDR